MYLPQGYKNIYHILDTPNVTSKAWAPMSDHNSALGSPIVHMAHEQGLGGEGIGLDLHICSSDFIHEAGLAHVGESTHQNSASIGINGR